jgi:DNA-binding response OmpR family regulator
MEALKMLNGGGFDLVILDVMLPGLTGFELIEYVKDIPVIFVTAKAGLNDKLKGLGLGAEDYIVKPFEMQELLARVSVVLRRVKRENSTFSFDNITVDFDKRCVYADGEEVKLTPKEYDLLETLILNRNIALTRDRLLSLVWDMDFEGDTRTVDIHIQQLRKKLGIKNRIISLYKIGYRFEI